MKIYNPDNTLLLDIDVNDSSFSSDEIMNEDTLSLEFESTEFIEIPVDAYCKFRNKIYYLLRDNDLTKNGVRNYAYKLVMYTDASKSKDVKYGFATVTKNKGELPKFDYAKKIEFNLTGKPIDFAQLWVDNMNIANSEDEWTVGECIDAPIQTLDFNDQWCFDILGQLAEAFETEWEIEHKTLHIRVVEKMKDSAFPLSYGLGKGLLKGISRVNPNDHKMINRLIMKGSDRNIAFSSYGDTDLHLPKNARIKYDGNYFSTELEFVDSPNAIEYVTDSMGSYLERSDREGRVREDSLDCTTIYPMHEGTITEVDDKNNLIFYDSANTINYYDMLIPGNTMQLIPQSGDLTGKEFDVNYNHAKKCFTLKRIEGSNDVSYPSGNLIPRVGDKYAIFKINLPQQYIDDAELRALKKCVKYLFENEVPQHTFTGELDPIYAEEHWLEIGGYLEKGYFVHFTDDRFLPDGRDIRITKVEYYVNDEKHPKITLSNKVSGKSFSNKQNKVDNQDQTIDRNKDEAIQYAKRRYNDTLETMEMLKDSLLNFSESINPISIQTMQLIAGDPTLQFRFVNRNTDPIKQLKYNIIYDPITKKLHCPSGFLQHMTLGVDSITSSRSSNEYYFWNMDEYLSPLLEEPEKRYYLYAKCKKSTTKDDGIGIFLLSKTAHSMESEADYYYFLVGILNREFDADRSFVTLYGFTEVLPGRITTDKIVSNDGMDFWDMGNNCFNLGGDSSGIDWNNTKAGELTIKGIVNALGAILGGFKIDNEKFQSTKVDKNGFPNILLNGITGEGKIGGWTVQDSNLIAGGNWNEEILVLDAPQRRIRLLDKFGNVIFAIATSVDATDSIPYLELNRINKSTGATVNSIRIGDGRIRVTNLPTSANGLLSGSFWRDGNTLKIVP